MQVICLIAPTASGKTALAYELYDTGRYHLISVDSALIYRDMNIGTAKPTQDELAKYPHDLVNIINPDETYSVAQFVNDVQKSIEFAHKNGKIPLLVGGTMMYYMAILDGIADIPATLSETRKIVQTMIANQGIEQVHAFLAQHDPVLANKFFPTDTQRIGRAVEVFLQTGKPLSQWQQQPNIALADNPNQQWSIYCVMPDRAWLHDKIALRLDMMWRQGFLQEVIALQENYQLHADMPSMRCVGYRQAWDFLQKIAKNPNENTIHARQAMQNQALYATRQLAKRQYTWMRKLLNTKKLHEQHNLQQFFSVNEITKLL
ncbi:tRNA delta(2)-isopentenylpyrophosphate transferase [Moraxella macacae 0408225]|uniref:tRNA dimethylallyltransferase n=1 Tax=Moraxella macacae 0408225 TaxID=1230338 RepID=L2F7V8_9GAMM|nr:tRNA (adenosine(37)-N6)-dimethylallyltransferase MiaA [Moraxella macacae]ELA08866.1 tRNA delta(2)-isopentenylpyrophosphate transferase [Moraxella macacae 0408225]